jgi:hypothetical protein
MLQAIFIARTPLFHDAFEGQCGQLGTSFRRTFGTRYAICTVFKIRPAHTFIILFVRLCTFALQYVAIIEQEIGLRQKRRETLDQETGWLNKHASNLQKWPTLLRSCWVLGDKIRNAILYA